MTPRFSIVTPTFDRPAFLHRALASIAAQTFRSYEVIVVDDHSAIPAVIPPDLALRNVRLIRHGTNRGPAAAYNTGIAAASGEFISILDDDDEFAPGFLFATAEAFDRRPDAEWAWCSVNVIDHGGAFSASTPIERRFPKHYECEEDLLLDALSIGNGFGFTVRADCYRRIGGYDETFGTAEDAELIYRLLSQAAFPIVISEPLVTIHNHDAVRRTGAAHDAARASDCERILQRHADFIGRWPRVAAQMDHHLRLLRGVA